MSSVGRKCVPEKRFKNKLRKNKNKKTLSYYTGYLSVLPLGIFYDWY